jgi:hypothetical protein
VVELTLGFVSTAVGKSEICKKLRSHLQAVVVDVDKVLCGLTATQEAIVLSGATQFAGEAEPPQLLHIMQRLPRTEVLRLWRLALVDALATLKNTDGDGPRVLVTGIMYHSQRRSEFYSPFDLGSLSSGLLDQHLRVKRVAMFIDDIYDMWARLASAGELFDPVDSLEEEYGRLSDSEGIDPKKLPVAQQALVASEVQTGQLVRLLHWRQLEVTQAERTAWSLGVPYLLWAVKQEIDALAPWLRGETGKVAYISHPISRPRRTRAISGNWPNIVTECNALQGQLAQMNCTAVMPTGIDEYRIRKIPNTVAGLRSLRLPGLGPRWPINPDRLLYSAPDGTQAPDYAELLSPHRLDDEKITPVVLEADIPLLDPPLRFLERQIAAQVSARDHTIVVNTDHIVVFRPFFDAPVVSGGVLAEIRHWGALARTEPNRRKAFLNRVSDVQPLLADAGMRKAAAHVFKELVATELGVDVPSARKAILAVNERTSDMLDTGAETVGERRETKEAMSSARSGVERGMLWRLLALHGVEIVSVPIEQVGLWVVPDADPWEKVLPDVVRFLSGTPVDVQAFSSALSLLPADLVAQL